jgi:hypothetical protein
VAKLRALLAIAIIVLFAAVPARLNARADAAAPVVPAVPRGSAVEAAPNARCADGAGTWMGMWWRGPMEWRINDATIPAYLDKVGVVAAIRAAATTVDTGRNDCGLPQDLGTEQAFLGGTGHVAEVGSNGGCGPQDGTSTVSFGRLNQGLLAVTCIWWFDDRAGGRSVEADILIDDTPGLFFLNTPAGCSGQWDLEGTVTHEFGHVFGLGHVSYAEHGDLTMTDGLPDCSTAYRGLGLGDYLTLRAHYGEH